MWRTVRSMSLSGTTRQLLIEFDIPVSRRSGPGGSDLNNDRMVYHRADHVIDGFADADDPNMAVINGDLNPIFVEMHSTENTPNGLLLSFRRESCGPGGVYCLPD